MIARADFDDREDLVRLLERRAGDDALRVYRTESHEAGENLGELADELGAAAPGPEARDGYDADCAERPEEHEWTPPPLSDVSDFEHDGAEAESAPEYDPEAHYPWIEERMAETCGTSMETPVNKNDEVERALPSDPIERLQVLVTAAKYGDESAVKNIRECLDKHPEIWLRVGDLAAHAESLLIEIVAEGNQMVVESMHREVERLKADLYEGEPSPLERLTVQRIVACWLHCQYADRAALAADAAGSRAATWGKQQLAAERRYQTSIRTLDTVRRLRPKATPLRAEPKPANATSPAPPKSEPTESTPPDTIPPVEPKARFSPENRIRQYETQKV
jgi:hypothetical protein